jgi:hypothetical protein
MALDNDNPKTSEETDKETDDQKTEVLKDEDMENKKLEDDPLFESQPKRDVGFKDFIEVFSYDNDKPEKEEMTKLEQDFVDSNSEKEAWKPSPRTSLNEEDSSNDEKKEPVAGSSSLVPKFVGTFITFKLLFLF